MDSKERNRRIQSLIVKAVALPGHIRPEQYEISGHTIVPFGVICINPNNPRFGGKFESKIGATLNPESFHNSYKNAVGTWFFEYFNPNLGNPGSKGRDGFGEGELPEDFQVAPIRGTLTDHYCLLEEAFIPDITEFGWDWFWFDRPGRQGSSA